MQSNLYSRKRSSVSTPHTFRWLLLAITCIGISSDARIPRAANVTPPVVTGNAKVDRLLSQMTMAEKIAMIHGAPEDQSTSRAEAGYLPGVPRLGIPSLRLTDGPPGISDRDESVGMTSTMGLAATFSKEDAQKNGVVIGRDARALGQDIVLEPFINMVRDFTFGRAYNTYGEDPLLTGQVAAALIKGIQSQGVMSQAKHYVAYDGGNDVIVDAQTLREIYIAPFVDAVNAGVSSVMCSYNKINGPYSCDNSEIQNKILKQEDGFKGFITSDWGAVHGTLFVNNGLDLEMPGAADTAPDAPMNQGLSVRAYFLANAPPPPDPNAPARGGRGGAGLPGGFGRGGGPPEEQNPNAPAGGGRGAGRGVGDPAPLGLLNAIQSGQVSETTITAAAGRILYETDKFGFLDKAPKHEVETENYAFDSPIIQKTAEDSAVLLKNQDDILPLSTAELASVAFIGPNAGQLISIGAAGEKALGIPAHQIGPVAAVEQLSGKRVFFAVANDMTGTPVSASALSHHGAPGLLRTDTKTNQTQSDSELNFVTSNGKALPTGSAYTWTGTLAVPKDGSYMLALQILGASGTLSLDGKQIASAGGSRGAYLHPMNTDILPTLDNLANARARIMLTAGPHSVSVSATGEPNGAPVQVRLNWLTPDQDAANYQAAMDAAKHAKKVVVFAWGRDRPDVFHLPGNQDKLIADIATVNQNTIVVLKTSLPVQMPWLDKVKAVLQMWWPGDDGGPATANILLGHANPAGRLPISWPASLDQMVANDPAHPERSSKGVDGKTTYSEGIFMGYRWFDKQNISPLYPFGYGMSYTKFAYSGLKISHATDGGLDVSFTIRNTGKAAGDEVPQIYLGAPSTSPPGVQFAVRALVAFDRVRIPAGQMKIVTLHVQPRQMQYWSTSTSEWLTANGVRTVYVGASSRDIRLHADTSVSVSSARR
jgi:beta-glucosidase